MTEMSHDPSGYPYLELLPVELVRHVFSFADIPSLGAMIQTGQHTVAIEASSDFVWADLVRRRFRVETQRTAPKYHGGRSWKLAYRSMSRCNSLKPNEESASRDLSHVSALFLPESAVWNYYTELPGGCLALTDRYRLLAT